MEKGTLQERHLTGLTRRRFAVGLCLGVLGTVAGCSGSSDDPALDGGARINPRSTCQSPCQDTKGAATAWDVVPNNTLALSAGSTFDLADHAAVGGPHPAASSRSMPSGAPLPSGITLLPTGLLTVSSSATGGTAGVVFRYTPPA